jgi:hypothetical protein
VTTPPLPSSYRWALLAAVVLGFQVALAAAFDVQAAINHDEPPPMTGSEAALPNLGLSPLAQRQVVLAAVSGYRGALEGMLPWRTASSALLSFAAGLVFFFGMRLRVSLEKRPAAALFLGRASIAAAALRAIDGAENLVLARNTFAEMGKAFVREGVADASAMTEVLTVVISALSGAWTLLVVAGFVTLGNYFRSETLRTALGRADP